MAQKFKAKTLLSNSGIFNNEVIAPNLVYNTGEQIISGDKIFSDGIYIQNQDTIVGYLSGSTNLDSVNNLTLKVYPYNNMEGYLKLIYGENNSYIIIGEDGLRIKDGTNGLYLDSNSNIVLNSSNPTSKV